MTSKNIITGNFYDKYHSSNPIYKRLMSEFLKNLLAYISDNSNKQDIKILEIGCGEGYLAYELSKQKENISYQGIDLDTEIIELAQKNCKKANFEVGSVYNLKKYQQNKYDYIIVSEVLEHLTEPEKALQEILKMQTKQFIFSVPNEPIWRILNMMRLKYLKNFGNTPGHLQHWSENNFNKLLSEYFIISDFKTVFPWLMALCTKKEQN